MAGKKLIDAKDFHLRVSKRKMTEIFPDWKELPEEVKELIRKHGKHLEMLLETQPTVDAVEVVHGQWEDGVCTACDFDIRELIDGESDFRNWVWEGLPYCPNCGAKMDGDGNG